MSKIIDFVKAHPYGVAIGVAGVGISYIYLKNSGASSASTTVDGSTDPNYATDVAAATALQQQQVAANVASLQSNNQAQTQITVAGYQSADTLAGIQAQQAADDASGLDFASASGGKSDGGSGSGKPDTSGGIYANCPCAV